MDYCANFESKTALVTGGAGGIGLEIARQLASAGARVCLLDTNAAQAAAAVARIGKQDQGSVDALIHSVGDAGVVQAICDYADKHAFEGFDLLVNAAGISPKNAAGRRQPAWNIEPTHWEEVLRTNLHGVFHTMSAVLPGMIQRANGAIVNIGSLAGRRYSPIAGAAYVTSKAGVEAITRQFAGEVAEYGVRINCVSPGRIQTPMAEMAGAEFNERVRLQTPLRRLGKPLDVAHAALFLLSDAAAFITGETLVVSGGRGL